MRLVAHSATATQSPPARETSMASLRLTLLAGPSLVALSVTSAAGQTVAAGGAPEDIGAATTTAASPGPALTLGAPTTASGFAPSRPDLDQLQPTSTIGAQQLAKFTIPTADYDDIVALTPSAMDLNPAGPGLQQDFGQSIRSKRGNSTGLPLKPRKRSQYPGSRSTSAASISSGQSRATFRQQRPKTRPSVGRTMESIAVRRHDCMTTGREAGGCQRPLSGR